METLPFKNSCNQHFDCVYQNDHNNHNNHNSNHDNHNDHYDNHNDQNYHNYHTTAQLSCLAIK